MVRLGKKRVYSLPLSLSYEKPHHDTPGNKVEGYPIMFLFSSCCAIRFSSHFSTSEPRIFELFLHLVIASCPDGANFVSCFYLDHL